MIKKSATNFKKSLFPINIKRGKIYIYHQEELQNLIKYASNAFLATKITFINEIANLCEKTGIDVEDISHRYGFRQKNRKDF